MGSEWHCHLICATVSLHLSKQKAKICLRSLYFILKKPFLRLQQQQLSLFFFIRMTQNQLLGQVRGLIEKDELRVSQRGICNRCCPVIDVWCHMPGIPGTQKAGAGGSHEPRSLRTAQATWEDPASKEKKIEFALASMS